MDKANKMVINVKDKIYNIEFLRILLICAIIVHHFYHIVIIFAITYIIAVCYHLCANVLNNNIFSRESNNKE